MNRRDALKNLFLMGSSITMGSFSHGFLENGSRCNAGNFNLYVDNDFFSPRTWGEILNKTLEKFQNVGIRFKKTGLLTPKEGFPKLQGLDILIAAIEDSLKYYAGYFGISESYFETYGWGRKLVQIDNYLLLKEKINLPYDRQVSQAHVGVVCLENTCARMETGEERETAVINTLAHEMGHGLGGAHVYDNVEYQNEEAMNYIMSQQTGKNEKKFCDANIKAMKNFIEFVNRNNPDDRTLIEERSKRLSECVYLEKL